MPDAIKVNKYTKEIKKKRRLNAKKLEVEEELLNRHNILEAGQDDPHKGAQAVIAEQKAEKKEKDKKDADFLTDLESKKKFHESYKQSLASALANLLEGLDWLPGWQAYCMATSGSPITIKGKGFSTKDGVLLIVTAPNDKVFHQGILVTGEPVLDYSALYTMAAQAENQMDQERGLLLDNQPEPPGEATILNQYGTPIKAD